MKLYKYIYILLISILFASACADAAYAQADTLKVSGWIINQANEPLSGVKIAVDGSKVFIYSDQNGWFNIRTKNNSILTLTKNGYQSYRLPSNEVSPLSSIKLSASLTKGGDSDIVNLPFVVKKQRELTEAVSVINGTDLYKYPVTAVQNTLSGRLAGLYVQQGSTEPGVDAPRLMVRGLSTYGSNQQTPLVLIDGAVRNFTDMDINEIESVTVLKDAAGTAWYGLRGANGIILVTTKRGNLSKTKITFDLQGGLQVPYHFTKSLNSYTYAGLYNEALQNDGVAPLYDQATLSGYQNKTDPYLYPNNNFPASFIKKSAAVQRYNVTASGGNNTARYFTAFTFMDQDGLFAQSKTPSYSSNVNFKRYNLRSNVDLHLARYTDVSIDLGGFADNRRTPTDNTSSVLGLLYNTPPNAYPLLNQNGTYGGSSLFQSNPLGALQARGNRTLLSRYFYANAGLKQGLSGILNGLSASGFVTFDGTNNYTKGYDQNYSVYNSTGTAFRTSAILSYAGPGFSTSDIHTELWGGLDYTRDFGKNHVDGNFRYQQYFRSISQTLDFKQQEVALRANYSYSQKYYLNVVASYSGSQNFALNKRYYWYPAASAGWIVSDDLFKPGKLVNYVKLRGSYGSAGYDGLSFSRTFGYESLFNRSGTGYLFGTSFSAATNASEQSIANPNLGPEKAVKTDIGADITLFDKAFDLTADYFYEKRTNLLTSSILPDIIGNSLVSVNDGAARYKGFEGSLTYHHQFNKLYFNIGGNFTVVKSKILSINEAGIPSYQSQVGFPVNNYRVLQAIGLFQTNEDVINSPVQQFSRRVIAGDIKYRDVNGDGFINGLDATTLNKTSTPTFYYGFSTKLAYQGFDLAVLFQGAGGNTLDLNSIINSGNANSGYINQFSVSRWTPASSSTALYPRLGINDRGNNTQSSTYWLQSGNYLRLKNVELGYSLPALLINKIGFSNLRIYVSGLNLLTFTHLDKAFDPEIPNAGYPYNIGSAGTYNGYYYSSTGSFNGYPYIKTYYLGLNAKF